MLNTNLKWKLLGTATGSNKVSIPTTFVPNELCAIVRVGTEETWQIPISIPQLFLRGTTRYLSSGFYASATENARVRIAANEYSININIANTNGSNVTSTSAIAVYYC